MKKRMTLGTKKNKGRLLQILYFKKPFETTENKTKKNVKFKNKLILKTKNE